MPLIIYNPLTKTKGSTDALTELVDVYPTLAEICGLRPPVDQLDGTSLVDIMSNPKLEGKNHIFIKRGKGFTLKTNDFSYTEFIRPVDNKTVASMLYDHRSNKDENINVVNQKEFSDVVSKLKTTLHTVYQKNITGNL